MAEVQPELTASKRTSTRWLFTVGLSFGSVLNPINSSIAAVALTPIGRDFGVEPAQVTWIVSALYIATAVGQPTLGRLADVWGPRKVYGIGLMLVGIGGLLGWLAPSLGVLVFARVVIGLGTSAAYPAAMVALSRAREQDTALASPSIVAWLTVAGQITLAVGPSIGGLLTDFFGWRWVMLVNLPLAAIGMVALTLWIPSDSSIARADKAPTSRIDFLGALLLAGTLYLFLKVLTIDLSQRIAYFGALVACFGAFCTRELTCSEPLIDIRYLRANKPLSTIYLRHAAVFLVHYSFMYGWPLWLEQATGRSPGYAGLLLLPSFAVAACVAHIAACVTKQKLLLAIGAGGALGGCTGLACMTVDSPLWLLLLTSMLFGLPEGLLSVGNQFAVSAFSSPTRLGSASGMLRTAMYFGAICSAPTVSLVFSRTPTASLGAHYLGVVTAPIALTVLVSYVVTKKLGAVSNKPWTATSTTPEVEIRR